MIAEEVSAKKISTDAGHASEDLGEVLALPAPAAKQDVDMPAGAKRLKANLIQAPILYDTSGSLNTVLLAWQAYVNGRHDVHLHKKNGHLPQLIESLISTGASLVDAVHLMTHIADHFQLTFDQMRGKAKMIESKTAKVNNDSLTVETIVTLGELSTALGWAYAQVTPRAVTANIL
ncbi:hypothetical protein ABBQ38_006401 [Trebouxia sp. C0009 RCD-2024]